MTNEESNDLSNDPAFRGRVKICCLRYADSIMLELPSVAAHNTRLRWAAQAMQSPDQVAAQTTPPVIVDPAVQSAGGDIDDAALQASVEVTIDKLL